MKEAKPGTIETVKLCPKKRTAKDTHKIQTSSVGRYPWSVH